MDDAIVFVHGGLGVGMAVHARRRRALVERLARLGVRLVVPSAPAPVGIVERARALAPAIEAVAARRIHLVGYSTGGLVARHIAARLDTRRRVATVVTIATPHRGTPVARWLLEAEGLLPCLARLPWRRTLSDLTPAAGIAFDETTPDRADVRYRSFAATRQPTSLPLWLAPLARRLADCEGDNDAVVPVASARRSGDGGLLHADHLEVIGLRRDRDTPFDAFGFVERLSIELAGDRQPAFQTPQGSGFPAGQTL